MPTGTVALRLPEAFGFKQHGDFDFQPVLRFFDWDIHDTNVVVDFTACRRADYQALSLLVLYLWHLRANGCYVEVELGAVGTDSGAAVMWKRMGATGWDYVLWQARDQFHGHPTKPLFAVRASSDFNKALETTSHYTASFNIEYEKTLHYIVSELLYNTIEHGRRMFQNKGHQHRLPSLIQFSWYKTRNQLQFIVADLGVGVKAHLEGAYPAFESDVEALRQAIRPQVSGTFGPGNGYTSGKNNAGVGLYISTGIVQRLRADMFLLSGQGLLHVSPRDVTAKTLDVKWPGTIAFLSIHLAEAGEAVALHRFMAELRERSRIEVDDTEAARIEHRLNVAIENHFGRYAENKEEAIHFRDTQLLPAVQSGKDILLDFNRVELSTHSFLSALLATPITQLGMRAYKRIRVTNATPEIRETIDYILDENTRSTE